MFLVRDTFQCKPGMAKEIVKKFAAVSKYMQGAGVINGKILTDVVANYWTVVLELEVESLAIWENSQGFSSRPEVREIMKDYMTMVEGGKREIYKIEHEIKSDSSKTDYKLQENIPA